LKNKEWNREKQKEYRKDPSWKDYYKQFSRHYYWNIIKPIHNKTLALQWKEGVAKKKKIDRGSGWYMLNHQLFRDFKRRPAYWYAVCEQAIKEMKYGERMARVPRNPVANDPEWQERMRGDW